MGLSMIRKKTREMRDFRLFCHDPSLAWGQPRDNIGLVTYNIVVLAVLGPIFFDVSAVLQLLLRFVSGRRGSAACWDQFITSPSSPTLARNHEFMTVECGFLPLSAHIVHFLTVNWSDRCLLGA